MSVLERDGEADDLRKEEEADQNAGHTGGDSELSGVANGLAPDPCGEPHRKDAGDSEAEQERGATGERRGCCSESDDNTTTASEPVDDSNSQRFFVRVRVCESYLLPANVNVDVTTVRVFTCIAVDVPENRKPERLPPHENSGTERDENDGDEDLESRCDTTRNTEVQCEEKGSKDENRDGVTDAPGGTGSHRSPLVLNECGYSGDVVGLKSVPGTERPSNEQTCADSPKQQGDTVHDRHLQIGE